MKEDEYPPLFTLPRRITNSNTQQLLIKVTQQDSGRPILRIPPAANVGDFGKEEIIRVDREGFEGI